MATVEQTIRSLQNLGAKSEVATTRAFLASGELVVRTAKDYSPISPKKNQIEAGLTRGAIKKNASTRINFNGSGFSIGKSTLKTKQQPTPGKLKKSIRIMSRDADHVAIGVPINSEAGDYAYKIHSMKNKPNGWKKRGIGTIRSGPKADELFITRAIKDRQDDIITIFSDELEKALNRL